MEENTQYQTPTTTAESISEGRMKVDVGRKRKKKMLKKVMGKEKYKTK